MYMSLILIHLIILCSSILLVHSCISCLISKRLDCLHFFSEPNWLPVTVRGVNEKLTRHSHVNLNDCFDETLDVNITFPKNINSFFGQCVEPHRKQSSSLPTIFLGSLSTRYNYRYRNIENMNVMNILQL